jgi:hypothetical protein
MHGHIWKRFDWVKGPTNFEFVDRSNTGCQPVMEITKHTG